MPRRNRFKLHGVAFHVMNRAVRGTTIFRTNRDFEAFATIVREGLSRSTVKVLSYQVLDNHWHFVMFCDRVADLSKLMHWVEGTHASNWAGAHKSRGLGYVYQGRFRLVPVQTSTSLIRVCRYVERNALRKNLVAAAEHWTWKRNQPIGTRAWETAVAPFMGMTMAPIGRPKKKNPGPLG